VSLRSIFVVAAALIVGLAAWLLLRGPDDTAHAAAPTPDGISRVMPSSAVPVLPTRAKPADANATPRPIASAAAADAPLPPPGRPLVEIFPELERLAKAGNVTAMCRLSFELERCRHLPGLRRFALESRLRAEEFSPVNALHVKRQLESAAFFQRRTESLEPICRDFPVEKTREGWKLLLDAAQAGHTPSMARFAWYGPPGDLQPLETLDGWIAFRDQAPQFLQRAIDAGEPSAFELAAVSHERGQWRGLVLLPKDPVRAAAYWMALERRASPGYAEKPRNAWQSIQREARFTPMQVAQAEALAAELVTKLRRAPPEGVDFAHGTFNADDGTHCEAP
jgi:hypothetical protein